MSYARTPSGVKNPTYRQKSQYSVQEAYENTVTFGTQTQERQINRQRNVEILPGSQEVYQSDVGELDYLYAIDLGSSLMTWEQMQHIKGFNVAINASVSAEHGINSQSFGPQEAGRVCRVCRIKDCLGHWGLLEWPSGPDGPLKILHPEHIGVIRDVLTVVCPECKQIYPDKNEAKTQAVLRLPARNRMDALKTIMGSKVYPECTKQMIGEEGQVMKCKCRYKLLPINNKRGIIMRMINNAPKVSRKEKTVHIRGGRAAAAAKDAGQNEISAEIQPNEIYEIVKNIPDEDYEFMGLNKSEVQAAITQGMLVMPSKFRSKSESGGKERVDQITKDLESIIKACAQYDKVASTQFKENKKGDLNSIAHGIYDRLELYHSHLQEKMKGKQGITRGQLVGKRGNYSGRAVISPSNRANFGEIIIPAFMAKSLTREIYITNDNLEENQKLLNAGRVTYITKSAGKNADQRIAYTADNFMDRSEQFLEPGDKIERWLQDGDWVVVARQPILNKQNIMAFRAIIEDNRFTIGLHISYTSAMHADFDGDTVSIWVSQSDESIYECERYINVQRNIMSYQNNAPIMGLIYNGIIGAYILTLPSTRVPQDVQTEIMSGYLTKGQLKTLTARLLKHHVDPLSGSALFSSVLPEDFYYENGKQMIDKAIDGILRKVPNPRHVKIVDGILVAGTLTKNSVGPKGRSIIQDMYKFYDVDGWIRVTEFITDATRMIDKFLEVYGFSIGVDDCNFAFNPEITDAIYKGYNTAELQMLLLKEPTNQYEQQKQEKDIIKIISDFKGIGPELFIDIIDGSNALMLMGELGAGAKGTLMNINSIGGTISQQFYANKRIEAAMTDSGRCLITKRVGDKSLSSRGFCKGNYYKGLDPNEYFFHAMGAREGLSDTTTKTPIAGQLQRLLMLALENIMSDNGAAIAQETEVLQFVYADDGMGAEDLVDVGDHTMYADIGAIAESINSDEGWIKPYWREKIAVDEYEEDYIKARWQKIDRGNDNVNSIRYNGSDAPPFAPGELIPGNHGDFLGGFNNALDDYFDDNLQLDAPTLDEMIELYRETNKTRYQSNPQRTTSRDFDIEEFLQSRIV